MIRWFCYHVDALSVVYLFIRGSLLLSQLLGSLEFSLPGLALLLKPLDCVWLDVGGAPRVALRRLLLTLYLLCPIY